MSIYSSSMVCGILNLLLRSEGEYRFDAELNRRTGLALERVKMSAAALHRAARTGLPNASQLPQFSGSCIIENPGLHFWNPGKKFLFFLST